MPLVRPGPGQHQNCARNPRQGLNRKALPFALDQRANAGEYGLAGRQAQFAAARGPVKRAEHRAVEPGAVDGDFAPTDPQCGQIIGQSSCHREQPARSQRCGKHLPRGSRSMAPIMDIRAARLDRTGQAEGLGDPQRGGAIGIKELRIDQIERLFGVQAPRERQHHGGLETSVKPPARARQQRKSRAQNGHAAALLGHGNPAQRPIPRVQREWEGRQPHGVDQHQIDIAARRHRLHLPLDKYPEVGCHSVGIKRR